MLRTGILAFANDLGFYRVLAVGTSAKTAVYPVDLERSADAVFPFPCVDWLKTVLSAVFCGVHVAVRSLFRLDAYPNLMSVKGCLLCLFGAFVPDYVIAGETNTYNYQTILKAVDLINKGARLIATNSDLTGPSEQGIIPACRALVSPIELATGKTAYYVGKPNPLMMRTGLRLLGVHSHEAAMIGDRMDTDIVAGIETGLDTVLVLSGCTTRKDVENYAYRPHFILDGVGCIPPQA